VGNTRLIAVCVALGIPVTGKTRGMAVSYALAILACMALYVTYVGIGTEVLGWKYGGGLIPMLVLLAAMTALWRGITKR
jgi:hypothetical protein